MADEGEPRRRTFVAKRLDCDRRWAVTVDVDDDGIDAALRSYGFDPVTRRLMPEEGGEHSGADEEPSLADSRWVRIMADYYADGVWDQDGVSCSAETLPVSCDVLARLRAWQADYDAHDDRDGPFLDLQAFAAEGLTIAHAIKAQLPDWAVVYLDESRVGGGRPRSAFEYEITLPRSTPDSA